jgi:hypothetical protein
MLHPPYSPNAVAARSKAWFRGSSLAGIAGSNPAGGMDVCVSSGRDLYFGLITRPEENYRAWCVCDLGSSTVRKPKPTVGSRVIRKPISFVLYVSILPFCCLCSKWPSHTGFLHVYNFITGTVQRTVSMEALIQPSSWAAVARSVQRLATGLTVRESNPC